MPIQQAPKDDGWEDVTPSAKADDGWEEVKGPTTQGADPNTALSQGPGVAHMQSAVDSIGDYDKQAGNDNILKKLTDLKRWGMLEKLPETARKATGAQENSVDAGGVFDNVSPKGIPGVSKIAGYLSGNALGRTALGTAQGAISSGALSPTSGDSLDDREQKAVQGAKTGFVTGAGSEALGAFLSGASRAGGTLKRAVQYRSNPEALQDEARGKIAETVDALRNSPQVSQVHEAINGTTYKVDPKQLMGIDPDVDAILAKAMPEAGALQGVGGSHVPDSVEIGGGDMMKIRDMLKDKGDLAFKQVQTTGATQIKGPDDYRRGYNLAKDTINSADGIGEQNGQVSEGLREASNLEKSRSPISSVSTSSADKRASLQRAGDLAGTDIHDYAKQVGAAKTLAKTPIRSMGLPLVGQGLSGAMKALGSDPGAVNAQTGNLALEQLLREIDQKK